MLKSDRYNKYQQLHTMKRSRTTHGTNQMFKPLRGRLTPAQALKRTAKIARRAELR